MSKVLRLSELCWLAVDDCGHQVLPVVNKKCHHLSKELATQMPPVFSCGCVADAKSTVGLFRGVKPTPKRVLEDFELELSLMPRPKRPSLLNVEEFINALPDAGLLADEQLDEELEVDFPDWEIPLTFRIPQWADVEVEQLFHSNSTYRFRYWAALEGDQLAFQSYEWNSATMRLICRRCAPLNRGVQGEHLFVCEYYALHESDARGRIVIPQHMRPSFYLTLDLGLFGEDREDLMRNVAILTVPQWRNINPALWEFHCSYCFGCLYEPPTYVHPEQD